MRSLNRAFASRLNILKIVKLLTKYHLEFLSLKGGYTCASESALVKMPYCWKSHAMAQLRECNVSKHSARKGSRILPLLFDPLGLSQDE